MGGPRSGTWYRWNTATTLNDRIAVDVRDWQRRELLVPGRHFSWAWSADGEVKDSIQVRVEHDRVTLVYKQRRPGDDWRSVEETITLTSTPCHFGGRRVWFVCPRCHDRAARSVCQERGTHSVYRRQVDTNRQGNRSECIHQ